MIERNTATGQLNGSGSQIELFYIRSVSRFTLAIFASILVWFSSGCEGVDVL
jgi:hypothetical protein